MLSVCALLLFPTGAQEIQHEAVAINIEVPVRVFKGTTFIEDLSIEDFEVWEDGELQKIEAVYLVKKTDITREEKSVAAEKARKAFTPQVARNFVLLFVIQEWLPKVGDAIDEFFADVIAPGDSLTVVTPLKTYNFNKEALEKLPKQEIAGQLKSKLRKDTKLANTEYLSVLKDLSKNLTDTLVYPMLLSRLETMREINESKLEEFSEFLKEKPGQKNVFLFYQKEILPQLDNKTLFELMSVNMDDLNLQFHIMDLLLYHRDVTFDVERIKRVFSDSSIMVNFLFLTKMPNLSDDGMPQSITRWKEQSEDVFSAFKQMADATGGFTESSANAKSAFDHAVDASENYYLLYYTPKDYRSDGRFRNIKVKVKGKNYRVLHRAGYLAD